MAISVYFYQESEWRTGESLGYLLVGLLAFALGVCVTVLCVRLHERERDEGSEEERGDA